LRRVVFLFVVMLVCLRPARLDADTPTTHTVAWGQTLYSIARTYGVTPQAIANANSIQLDGFLYAGMRLKIPASDANAALVTTPSGFYTVRAGDTLFAIAARFNTTTAALSEANDLPANGLIYTGWTLKIPKMDTSAVPTFAGSARSYVVQAGETLAQIAMRHDTTTFSIAQANDLPNGWMIYAGQRLVLPGKVSARSAPVASTNDLRVSGVPLLRQKQTLTCEQASAAMASRGVFTEDQLLGVMPRSDNPFEGIRGHPNGTYFGGLSDYGVYAQGLQKGLAALNIQSQVLHGQSYDEFKDAILDHLRAGRAIVWWHTWQDSYQTPVMVKLNDGKSVKLVPYEHASVIVAANERGVTYHDPYDASVRFVGWKDFQRVSAYFDNMALVVMTNDK